MSKIRLTRPVVIVIFGAAGDLAFEKIGYSLMATDVIDNIPDVLRRNLKKVQ